MLGCELSSCRPGMAASRHPRQRCAPSLVCQAYALQNRHSLAGWLHLLQLTLRGRTVGLAMNLAAPWPMTWSSTCRAMGHVRCRSRTRVANWPDLLQPASRGVLSVLIQHPVQPLLACHTPCVLQERDTRGRLA